MSFVQVNANQIPIPTLYGLVTSVAVPSGPTGGVGNNGHVDPTQMPIDSTSATPTFASGVVTGGTGGMAGGASPGPGFAGATVVDAVGATLTSTVAQLTSLNPTWWILAAILGFVVLKKHH